MQLDAVEKTMETIFSGLGQLMQSPAFIAVAVLLVSALALLLTWHQYRRDKAELRISLQLVDKSGSWGLIVDNKDHLFVSALNVGRRPVVLQGVDLDLTLRWPYWLKRMQYSGKDPFDVPGSYTSGGSHDQPVQVDPGFTFKMQLDLSTTVLVGQRRLNQVIVRDSVGQIHTPGRLEMFLIRRALRKHRAEWRARFDFRRFDESAATDPKVEEQSQPRSAAQQPVEPDVE